ncbi:MAG: hypothetical protein Q7V57_11110 [Actinomycetota bacterium]|nr:hypothetical protein [Actinomycetota bacterium]
MNEISVFDQCVAAGFPVARLELSGLHSSRVVVVATNLDGSVWVRLPAAGGEPLCVERGWLSGLGESPLVAPSATGLGEVPVRMLVEYFRAGQDGLADHQVVSSAASMVAGYRLQLATRGLVVQDASRVRPSPGGVRAHIWMITSSGREQVRPPCPRPPVLAATG